MVLVALSLNWIIAMGTVGLSVILVAVLLWVVIEAVLSSSDVVIFCFMEVIKACGTLVCRSSPWTFAPTRLVRLQTITAAFHKALQPFYQHVTLTYSPCFHHIAGRLPVFRTLLRFKITTAVKRTATSWKHGSRWRSTA